MCYAASAPGGSHVPFDDCVRAIDRLVECEGRPEILQLSGGEPTIHPQFLDVFRYAVEQPIDIVMINTNGIRLARDDKFRRGDREARSTARKSTCSSTASTTMRTSRCAANRCST